MMMCPIQVAVYEHWIDCESPRGHDGPHSWQIPGAPVFVMAPPASELRNREQPPLWDTATLSKRQETP